MSRYSRRRRRQDRYSYGWRPYVPVGARLAKAKRLAAETAKKEGREPQPVEIEGRKIAKSFWGQAWCDNLNRHSDFANRLPRGGTYVRGGMVTDLLIEAGKVRAIVGGSEAYTVAIQVTSLSKPRWKQIKDGCAQSITSLIDLLQGRFDDGIMQRLTEQDGGLLPQPKELQIKCSCPDYATLCKHAAATLYGVGARLDQAPELLFKLRGVDHLELIQEAVADGNLQQTLTADSADFSAGDLGEIFGIDLETSGPAKPRGKARSAKPARRFAPADTDSAPESPRAQKTKRPPKTTRGSAKKSRATPDAAGELSPAGLAAARQLIAIAGSFGDAQQALDAVARLVPPKSARARVRAQLEPSLVAR